MKKLYLLALLLLGFCCCINNQESVDDSQTKSVESRTATKSVRNYIEGNDFLDFVPELSRSISDNMSEEEKLDETYRVMAATYRFYKNCTQDEDGIVTCHINSGKEINVSEELFEFCVKNMEGNNNWVRKCKKEGKKYGITRLGEKYFNDLLNFK